MEHSLTWLPDVLHSAGLKVAEVPGWRERGRGDVGPIRGVMCHHTAGPTRKHGVMPSLHTVVNGRPAEPGRKALPGPLAQLGLARDGTFFVVAAGRANHAGDGKWEELATGNSSFIGIEAENTGLADDEWPDVQVDAYQRGVAAILNKIGADSIMCCGHKEYALPKGRKPDPSFDMLRFREGVAAILAGNGTPRPLIPGIDGQMRLTIRRGAHGELVRRIQQKLELTVDGAFGPQTEAAVRDFQREEALVPDGIVGPKTWAELDKLG